MGVPRFEQSLKGATIMNLTKIIMTGIAALTLTAGAVYGQTLKADIPFAFQVSGKAMPAGTYTFDYSKLSTSNVIAVHSQETKAGGYVARTSTSDPNSEWKSDGQPKLQFECAGDGQCALTKAWTGGDSQAFNLAHPKSVDMNTRISVIVMRPEKGE
jgi:hypothetical protein